MELREVATDGREEERGHGCRASVVLRRNCFGAPMPRIVGSVKVTGRLAYRFHDLVARRRAEPLSFVDMHGVAAEGNFHAPG